MIRELVGDTIQYARGEDYQPKRYPFKGETHFYPSGIITRMYDSGIETLEKGWFEGPESDPYCLHADQIWRNDASLPRDRLKRVIGYVPNVMICLPAPSMPSLRLDIQAGEVFIKSSFQEFDVGIPTGLVVIRGIPYITSGLLYERDSEGFPLNPEFVLIARRAHVSLASVREIRAKLLT